MDARLWISPKQRTYRPAGTDLDVVGMGAKAQDLLLSPASERQGQAEHRSPGHFGAGRRSPGRRLLGPVVVPRLLTPDLPGCRASREQALEDPQILECVAAAPEPVIGQRRQLAERD